MPKQTKQQLTAQLASANELIELSRLALKAIAEECVEISKGDGDVGDVPDGGTAIVWLMCYGAYKNVYPDA